MRRIPHGSPGIAPFEHLHAGRNLVGGGFCPVSYTHLVRRLVELLPDEQREVVMMRYYGGLSFKEIAEQTDVSINTMCIRDRAVPSALRSTSSPPVPVNRRSSAAASTATARLIAIVPGN